MREIHFYCSGRESGLGHLSRSRALADALAGEMSIVFRLVNMTETQEFLTDHFRMARIPVIAVIDFQSRMATEKLANSLKGEGCFVIVIGDETLNIDVDVFICPGPHSDTIDYKITKAKHFLLGPSNALLNNSFCNQPWTHQEFHRGTVISVGSTVDDATLYCLATKALAVSELVTIITPHLIPQLVSEDGITQLVDVEPNEIANAYRVAEVAITGCGVSSLEALAIGTPLALLSIGPIQERVALEYTRIGVGRYLGPLSLVSIDSAMEKFRGFHSESEVHKIMNARAQKLHIADGITNVRNFILGLIS
jgi:spore coat polysaccharide biosynthesis predicted glycosyltransferase SpsG